MDMAIAKKLWDFTDISIGSFLYVPREHPQSLFLGYADVVIDIPKLPGFTLKIRGIGVKILKGAPLLELPTEKGADEKYYPVVYPVTAELREVLTKALFKDQRILDAIEAAAKLFAEAHENDDTPTEPVISENPFEDEAATA